MKPAEITDRVNRIQSSHLAAAEQSRNAMAAQFNAAGRLNSGSYFIAVRDSLLACLQQCLDDLASFATTVLPPKQAAALIEQRSLLIVDELRQIMNKTLLGEGGSKTAPNEAANEIRSSFANKADQSRAAMIETTRYGLAEHTISERGIRNFLKRNAPVILSNLLAVSSLIISVLAYLKK